MEGLIPFLIHTIKRTKNVHNNHGYSRSFSDGSRRGYELLGSAGESVSGSSHRRTRSEFKAPAFKDLHPEVDDFIRSHSFKNNNSNSNSNSNNNDNKSNGYVVSSGTSYSGLRQLHHSLPVAADNIHHQKQMTKILQY
ncbi:hypothetical protein RND81_06G193700 [Saponaria officinalis]|uniref:Uncharacterized protein n=1 Tax=Saponaria officinalis TaxID=3572 RepID=A0AAW1KEW3_SAPOF